MTQEDKELLVKDLCARLPYGVKVHLIFDKNLQVTRELGLNSLHDIMFGNAEGKPYLRPMSSMTEEEKREFSVFGFEVINHINAERGVCPTYQVVETKDTIGINKIFDWLNKNHFDYRDLIPKGLAIEVTENNNPYKD